jgi:hypothetical protein
MDAAGIGVEGTSYDNTTHGAPVPRPPLHTRTVGRTFTTPTRGSTRYYRNTGSAQPRRWGPRSGVSFIKCR